MTEGVDAHFADTAKDAGEQVLNERREHADGGGTASRIMIDRCVKGIGPHAHDVLRSRLFGPLGERFDLRCLSRLGLSGTCEKRADRDQLSLENVFLAVEVLPVAVGQLKPAAPKHNPNPNHNTALPVKTD